MWRRNQESPPSDKARSGLLHSRAMKRARRRLSGETERVNPARRVAWAVIEIFWLIQERLLWPSADATRAAAEWMAWRLEDLGWAIRRRLIWPVSDRLDLPADAGSSSRRRAFATGLATLAALALVAGALAASGDDAEVATADTDSAPEGPSLATVTEEPRPVIVERTEEPPDGPALSGARPSFESGPADEVERARQIIEAREAREADRRDGGSGEGEAEPEEQPEEQGEGSPPIDQQGIEPTTLEAEHSEATPRELARRTAHRFARAFIAYELGSENEAIGEVFDETASPRLSEELDARPPRLPRDGRVPRAQIVNVVDGPREGRRIEVSVSLLRLDSLAELRLDLFRTGEGWRVGAVKG